MPPTEPTPSPVAVPLDVEAYVRLLTGYADVLEGRAISGPVTTAIREKEAAMLRALSAFLAERLPELLLAEERLHTPWTPELRKHLVRTFDMRYEELSADGYDGEGQMSYREKQERSIAALLAAFRWWALSGEIKHYTDAARSAPAPLPADAEPTNG